MYILINIVINKKNFVSPSIFLLGNNLIPANIQSKYQKIKRCKPFNLLKINILKFAYFNQNMDVFLPKSAKNQKLHFIALLLFYRKGLKIWDFFDPILPNGVRE